MTILKKFLIVAYLSVLVESIDSDCLTASGSLGNCVNLKNCNNLFSLLRNRPVPGFVYDVLRSAQCGFEGFEPRVCCDIYRGDKLDLSPVISESKLVISEDQSVMTTTPKTTTAPPVVPVEYHPNRRLLPENICGPVTEGRIYGGDGTSTYEFPWMALLAYHVGKQPPQFRCGGSLINKNYVLTAAHCTTALANGMKLVSVRIGDHDLSSDVDCDDFENGVGFNCASRYQDFKIESLHVHPEYSKRKYHNDIALIRLKGEADMSTPSVRPICLPLGKAAFLRSRKVVVTGWGATERGTRSDKLLKVALPVVPFEKCSNAYRRQVTIWHKQICAGGMNNMDSCSGDSGGPLQSMTFNRGKPRIVQYGIVSFGFQTCGIAGYPGVYTSVPHYVRWILDQMTD